MGARIKIDWLDQEDPRWMGMLEACATSEYIDGAGKGGGGILQSVEESSKNQAKEKYAKRNLDRTSITSHANKIFRALWPRSSLFVSA